MNLGQGFPEWTELGQDSGLDPLGMQRPIEAIYQSLVPGISTITLRYRYYSFFSFIFRHYEQMVRHPDPEVFRLFQRRCEALFALICTYRHADLGIAGSNRANEVIAKCGETGIIDFIEMADPNADESQRYLRNKGGAFGAIYATQMSAMGLIHFPDRGQSNPNPVCSNLAIKLAEAFSQELGETAEEFFEVANTGKIPVSSLGSFEMMKPSQLKPGSDEHRLLKDILLGNSDVRNDKDMMRRKTLLMLLEITDVLGSIPQAEKVKWHWFENVPTFETDQIQQVPQLWFLYQACDLMRLAYETILSAALTLLQQAPRRKLSLSELTDALADYIEASGNETWERFSKRLTEEAPASAVQEAYTAMMGAREHGETVAQMQNAVLLIALLTNRAINAKNLMEQALGGADYFQSLRTETNFLNTIRTNPAIIVVAELIRNRVLKRHLWVASRKFRNQGAYTFHMEPEEGLLRYRSDFRISPSSPRIDQALRFLQDINLINEQGLTPAGRAEMAAA